jgi:hypothetical protein
MFISIFKIETEKLVCNCRNSICPADLFMCNDIQHAYNAFEYFKEILKIRLGLLTTRNETFVISDEAPRFVDLWTGIEKLY